MLELELESAPVSVDPRTIDEASDAQLDALGFGVIGLDPSGVVLRYNLYESRLARLDRNQVLGRNFFDEVARCTRTDEFQGRFERLLRSGAVGRSERFEFVFGFSFGEQRVGVEMVLATPSRIYLLVNRLRVSSTRTLGPDVPLAAAQRELAPDESSLGVRRDTLERRFVEAPAILFAALRATCDRVAPESWQLFAGEWGVQWGRRAAIDLEAGLIEQGKSSLRDLPMRELADLVAASLARTGWGRLGFDFSFAAEGLVVASLERSALAEAPPRTERGGVGEELSCHLVSGWLSGVMSHVAERRLAAREVACRAAGAPRCAFAVVAHERRRVVDQTIKQGLRGVEPIRDALRRAPPAEGRDGAASR